MRHAGAWGRAALIALSVAGPAAAQDGAVLTPDQVRAASVAALEAGDLPAATAFAQGLLIRDPDDVTALIVLSRAALATGDFDTARTAGARAYAAAGDNDSRFIAARLTARAHAEDRQDTRAQFWLRRARQYAPTDNAAASVAEDYRFLARRNPLSVRLRFGIAPSNNVNNGSIRETSQLFGLPFEFELSGAARALSGIEYTAGVSGRYRLAISDNAVTYATAGLNLRSYTLSSDAKEQAPEAEGSDFSDANLSLGLSHRRILAQNLPPTDFSASIGQGWYGGDPYTRFLSLGVGQEVELGEADSLEARLTWRQTAYLDDDPGLRPDTTTALSLGWQHGFANGDRISVTGGYRVNDSDDLNRDYTARTVDLSYDRAEPFAGLRLGFDLGYEERIYANSRLAGGERRDDVWTGGVTAEFTQVEYYGFRPVARVEASQGESNVDLFDRGGVSLRFDLVSAF